MELNVKVTQENTIRNKYIYIYKIIPINSKMQLMNQIEVTWNEHIKLTFL